MLVGEIWLSRGGRAEITEEIGGQKWWVCDRKLRGVQRLLVRVLAAHLGMSKCNSLRLSTAVS